MLYFGELGLKAAVLVGSRIRVICLVLSLLSAAGVSGCFVGTAGVVLGILSATGGGGSVNQPPVAPDINSTSRMEGGRVRIEYKLFWVFVF